MTTIAYLVCFAVLIYFFICNRKLGKIVLSLNDEITHKAKEIDAKDGELISFGKDLAETKRNLSEEEKLRKSVQQLTRNTMDKLKETEDKLASLDHEYKIIDAKNTAMYNFITSLDVARVMYPYWGDSIGIDKEQGLYLAVNDLGDDNAMSIVKEFILNSKDLDLNRFFPLRLYSRETGEIGVMGRSIYLLPSKEQVIKQDERISEEVNEDSNDIVKSKPEIDDEVNTTAKVELEEGDSSKYVEEMDPDNTNEEDISDESIPITPNEAIIDQQYPVKEISSDDQPEEEIQFESKKIKKKRKKSKK